MRTLDAGSLIPNWFSVQSNSSCPKSDSREGLHEKNWWLSYVVRPIMRCFCKLVWCYSNDKCKRRTCFVLIVVMCEEINLIKSTVPAFFNTNKWTEILKIPSLFCACTCTWTPSKPTQSLSQWQLLTKEISLGRNSWFVKKHLCLSKGRRIKRKPYFYFSGHPG